MSAKCGQCGYFISTMTEVWSLLSRENKEIRNYLDQKATNGDLDTGDLASIPFKKGQANPLQGGKIVEKGLSIPLLEMEIKQGNFAGPLLTVAAKCPKCGMSDGWQNHDLPPTSIYSNR